MQDGPPEPPSKGGPLRRVIGLTRALIFDQHTRRVVMFYAVLGAMLMAFGDGFIGDWLRERVQRFAVYWLVCAWLTLLAALLAIYDLLLIRVQERAVRRKLREELVRKHSLEAIEAARRAPPRDRP